MRAVVSRYASQSKPATIKKRVAQTMQFSAPLEGLSLSSKMSTSDRAVAPILDNFVVLENKIECRAGYNLVHDMGDGLSIETLVPWYGPTPKIGAASGGLIRDAFTGTTIGSGYGNDDWAWTSFSNLGEDDFTVMVNGVDGVLSWDGGSLPDGVPLTVTDISKANPAVATVADASGLAEGAHVVIAGITGDFAFVNGTHIIGNITATTFDLLGVDTSAVAGVFAGTVTVMQFGSIIHEEVTAPAAEPWIDPLKFDKVLSHINRLWFADSKNLAVYYLPLQQKTGEVKLLPLNVLFRRGGHIRALATWSIDGGDGINDRLVIFSSNGECVIYAGIDPDSDFSLVGIFRFDSPLSRICVQNYGGDLYILSGTGVMPLSTLMKAETEELGESDTDVYSAFNDVATLYRTSPGWQLGLDHTTGRFIANMPLGAANRYQQMIRFMPKPVWARWRDIPSRFWLWINHRLYFSDDKGRVYEMNPTFRSDEGQAITVDVQWAWHAYKSAGVKHFKMLKPFVMTDGNPKLWMEMRVDYDTTRLRVTPDITTTDESSAWDVSYWDDTYWAAVPKTRSRWEGAAGLGDVGAPRLRARVLNCYFAINGIHVLFEAGSVFG
jgi:hypothetical protein